MPITVGDYGGFPVIPGRETQARLEGKAGSRMNSGTGKVERGHTREYEAAEQSEEPGVRR